MHFAQGLFYGATANLVAAIVCEAGGEDHGAVDSANDIEDANALGVAGKLITPVGALNTLEETGLAQLLQNLREDRQGDTVGLGNFFGAGRARYKRAAHGFPDYGELPKGD